MLENFKNLYEVRKSAKFKIIPHEIYRKIEKNSKEYNVENIVTQYEIIIKSLQDLLYYEDLEVEKKAPGTRLGDLFDFSKLGIVGKEKNEKFSLKDKESSDLIRIKHGWLQKFFTKEWHENKESIISKRFDKKKNIEVKTKNWITIGSVQFLKIFFEEFFGDANIYFNEVSDLIKTQDFEKNRKSDIKFALQKIQGRNHLYKIYKLFEGGYIEHKNNVSLINELKQLLQEFKNNVDNYIDSCRINDSFGLPVEYISLNYYTRRKTQKNYEDDIFEKSKLLTEKFNGDLGELYGIKNENIRQLYEDMKIFKAHQKSEFLQLLQKRTSFEEFSELVDLLKESERKYKSFGKGKLKDTILKQTFENIIQIFGEDKTEKIKLSYKTILFHDLDKEKYNYLLNITQKIEKSSSSEGTRLKKQRGESFMYKDRDFSCKRYIGFCSEYKKVAIQFGKRKAEVLSLEREKILAEKEKGYGFLSKDINNNYYINTFDIENAKNAYEFFSNQSQSQKEGEITYYILSSITLRALEKLCFSRSSNFNKGKIIQAIDDKFLNVQEATGYKIFKSKNELVEEGILVEFLVEVLRLQTTLGIKFKSEKSLDYLKYCKNISDFEILLKQETYILDEYKISKKDFKEALKKFQGNSFLIVDKDTDNHNKNSTFSQWWTSFWSEKNTENYILRINPELIISLRQGDEEKFKDKISFHRKKNDVYMVSFNFSHFSDKSYISSEFIDDAERKENLKKFNDLYNKNVNLDYIYGIDKGTNELVTLGIFKRGKNGLKKVDISEKIPVYRITKKGLQHFEYIQTKDSNEKKKRYLSKNVSYFLKDLENNELFEKLEINSCLGDLTYAKIIKGSIILNADIFTTVNLYKVTGKRFLNDATLKGKIKNNVVLFDDENKYFYFEYENRGKIQKQVIFYWKNEFNYLPCDEVFTSLKEEIQNELSEYLKGISNEEDISIQKVNNYKNAISANIVGIITELQKHFNGYICYETLDAGQVLGKGFSTFIGNTVNEKMYNKLQLSLEVPPILKKFRTDIGTKEIIQHGKVIYVNEKNTSSACPVCNETLLKTDKNGNLVDKDDKEVFKLFGHLTELEHSMHHINDNSNVNYQKGKWKFGNLKNGDACNYYIGNSKYPEFDFIKSGDDLATYNIAKKAKEYLEKTQKTINNLQNI